MHHITARYPIIFTNPANLREGDDDTGHAYWGRESWGHLTILPTTDTGVNFLVLITVLRLCNVNSRGNRKTLKYFCNYSASPKENLKTQNKNHVLGNNTTVCKYIISCALACVVTLNLPKGSVPPARAIKLL